VRSFWLRRSSLGTRFCNRATSDDPSLELIPCESARVLLLESDARLFLAREVERYESNRRALKYSSTWVAADNHFLMQVLAVLNSLLIRDTSEEKDWVEFSNRPPSTSVFPSVISTPPRVRGGVCVDGPVLAPSSRGFWNYAGIQLRSKLSAKPTDYD